MNQINERDSDRTNDNSGRVSIIHNIYESLQVKFSKSKQKSNDLLPDYDTVVNQNSNSKLKDLKKKLIYIINKRLNKNKDQPPPNYDTLMVKSRTCGFETDEGQKKFCK